MNKQAFLDLIKHPTNISSEALRGLEEVVVNFPYCQSAHILIAKGFHEQGSMLTIKKLSKAAVYSLDRKSLKKFITSMPYMPKAVDDVSPKPLELEKPSVEDVQPIAEPEAVEKAELKIVVEPPAKLEVTNTSELIHAESEQVEIPTHIETKTPVFETFKPIENPIVEKPETSNIRNWIEAQKSVKKLDDTINNQLPQNTVVTDHPGNMQYNESTVETLEFEAPELQEILVRENIREEENSIVEIPQTSAPNLKEDVMQHHSDTPLAEIPKESKLDEVSQTNSYTPLDPNILENESTASFFKEELKEEFDLEFTPSELVDNPEEGEVNLNPEQYHTIIPPSPVSDEGREEINTQDIEARKKFFEELEQSLNRLREFRDYSSSRIQRGNTSEKQQLVNENDHSAESTVDEYAKNESSEGANPPIEQNTTMSDSREIESGSDENISSDQVENAVIDTPKTKDKKQIESIIEKFIQEEPSIPHFDPSKLNDNTVDLAESAISNPVTVVSENFAKILERQMKYDKAIEIYKQLTLKYPEKSTYFAGLIENLKNKI